MNKNEIDALLLKLEKFEKTLDRFLEREKNKKQEPIIKRTQEDEEVRPETETETEEYHALFIQEEEERRRYYEKW